VWPGHHQEVCGGDLHQVSGGRLKATGCPKKHYQVFLIKILYFLFTKKTLIMLNFIVQTPVTDCSLVEIPVPSQPKLHKQWCLFDQAENIDFDTEVRKIENKEKLLKKEARGQTLFANEEFLAELTLLDVQSPKKRALDSLFEDFTKLQDVGGFAKQQEPTRYKKKRHTEHSRVPKHVKNNHVTANTKIVRMTKNVSHQ
jgi:hypothetical protein